MEFLHPHEQEIHEQLRALALPHIQRYGDKLELLPLDPGIHPAQNLRTSVVEGNPLDGAVIEALGADVDPAFPHLVERLDQTEEEHSDLSRLGENLHNGQNILLVTNHGELTDIALTLGAFYARLQAKGYQFRSSIIISKMISHVGYRLESGVAPATDLLQVASNDIFLSFPSTESIKRSRIDSHFIKRYNKQLLAVLTGQLQSGGNLFAMAASGATDKPHPEDETTMRLGSISPNTARLMMARHSLVVPVAVWLKGDTPVFEMCDIPRAIRTTEEAHDVMGRIAATLNEHVPDRKFVYHTQTPATIGKTGVRGFLPHRSHD